METIFKNIYPVTDQIDILIGNMYDKLNIYNITNTISQKNFVTNVQNNLHIIYNTPIYTNLVSDIELLENVCNEHVNNCLPNNNDIFNKRITNKIMSDVVYNNIFNNLDKKIGHNIDENQNISQCVQNNDKIYYQIQKILKHFTKDHDTSKFVSHLVDDINYILKSFELHNTFDEVINETLKAYNFGSTSSVYIIENNNMVMKVYNDKLRWTRENHKDINSIFEKEVSIMEHLGGMSNIPLIIDYDKDKLLFRMFYTGTSLYDYFCLPCNWKEQINKIFSSLTSKNIYYPEFNLNNIVVINNIISFVDFGLAEMSDKNNDANSKAFIELLEIINKKYENVTNLKKRHILYNTFMNNMRQNNKYPNNIF